MATNKQVPVKSQITYKREKGKMEITGDADKIKNHIWFDQITWFLLKAFPFSSLLFLRKLEWFSHLLKWLKGL